MEEESSAQNTGTAERFTALFISFFVSTGVSSFLSKVQDNAYNPKPNNLYWFYKLTGESTSLTSAPFVFLATSSVNMVLICAEILTSRIEILSQLAHLSQYITPFAVVLAYCLAEQSGGITTPDIGPDSLSGDIISSCIGGAAALLVTALADVRSCRRSS